MTVLAWMRKASRWGPVLFGVGFVAPLVAQSLDAAAVSAPFGLGSLTFGLAVGISLGAVAKVRGSWI